MKIFHKVICLILVVAICMTMVISASAKVGLNAVSAGIYGTLSCSSKQNDAAIYGKTTVTTNPDSAYLLVKYTFNLTTDYQYDVTGTSTRGVTSFEYTRDFSVYPSDALPIYVYFCGEVRGGSQSPTAYVTTTLGYSIDTSLMGG